MTLWVQDYARLHDYECVAASSLADPGLRFMWNKVAWLQLTMQVQAFMLADQISRVKVGLHRLASVHG